MINRQTVYKKYNGHCSYCGKEIKYKDMQIDHMKAKYNNPAYSDIDMPINLMPSCRRCNYYKNAHSIEIFRMLISTVHERVRENYIAKVAEDYGVIKYEVWDGVFYFEKCEKSRVVENV